MSVAKGEKMAFKKRYILAQEAEERIVSLFRKERNDAAEIFNTAIDACQSIILDMYDNAPDAVPVVRCKDCKFWGESLTEEERNECGVYADLVCTYWMSDGLTRDDFCSKGERREDD